MSRKLDRQILDSLLDLVVKKYDQSKDFNGLCVSELEDCLNLIGESSFRALILSLLKGGMLTLNFCGIQHPNPHIKAFPALSIVEQEKYLFTCPLDQICLYPSPRVLSRRIDKSKYADCPYTRELKLGGGQLEARFFKLEVLERYSKDPKYEFWTDGTSGRIRAKSSCIENGTCLPDDQFYLDFGYGYSDDVHKQHLVTAYPRYLHDLPSKHQLHWYSYQIKHGLIDKDFAARTLRGEFTENVSVYDAILQQIFELNTLCNMIGLPQLFNNTYDDGIPDDRYGPLKRTTQREYGGFAVVLRKVILDNVNPDFFKKYTSTTETGIDARGKKITKYKSVTRLLEEWFNAVGYRPGSGDVIPSIIDPLRSLDKTRGKEAHSLYDDEHSANWINEQKKLITSVYNALDGLRIILSTHPRAKTYKAPGWLEERKIKF